MNAQEISAVIRHKKYLFEVHNSSGERLLPKTNTQQAEMNAGSVDTLLSNIAGRGGYHQLVVQLYAPNGTSFLKRGTHVVEGFNPSTKTVETPTNTVDRSTKTVETTNNVVGLGSNLGAVIENGQLKTEIRYLKQDNDRLSERNKTLEKKVDELTDQNLKLTRDNVVSAEKNSLELQKVELENLKARKSTLGGLLDEAKSLDPETVATLVGIFNPKHPMVSMVLGKGQQQALPAGDTIAKHTDADAQACIEAMVKFLNTQPAAICGMLVPILDTIARDKMLCKQLYEKFSETASTTTNNDNNNGNDTN